MDPAAPPAVPAVPVVSAVPVVPAVPGGSPRIAFQGEPGANSDAACREVVPDLRPLPCPTFEDAFAAVTSGAAELAMIPIENSIAGRVADIHHLLPDSGLYIVGEHFLPIHFQVLGLPRQPAVAGPHGPQPRARLRAVPPDRAGARLERRGQPMTPRVPRVRSPSWAIRPSPRSPRRWRPTCTTCRCWPRTSRTSTTTPPGSCCWPASPPSRRWAIDPVITTFVFRVRNVPAALYKAIGGFATNGVNMTKLESYQLGGTFFATQFYADVEGHPKDTSVALALEELSFFSVRLRILGTYPASPFRAEIAEPVANRELRPSPTGEAAP